MADNQQSQAGKEEELVVEEIMDLDKDLREPVKGFIKNAFIKQTNLIKMCEFIKAKLQEKEEGKWNVIIGKEFASDVVHRSRKYGLYHVGELSILIWQSGGLEVDKSS